jgi:acetyl esterase/lipase
MLPLRGEFDPIWKWYSPGVHVVMDVFGRAFANSGQQRADASPISHVHRGLPPFLIFAAQHDIPTLGPQADEFHSALLANGCESRLTHVFKRNHNSILFSAISIQDPTARAIVEFVRK